MLYADNLYVFIKRMNLSEIKGLKEKRIAELEKAGIKTPMDLLSCFPIRYVDLYNLTDFNSVCDGDFVVFSAVFTEKPKTAYIKRNYCMVKVKFDIEGKSVYCVWFNQKYFASGISVGQRYYIFGKAKTNGNVINLANPKTVLCDKCESRFLVIYKPLKNINSSVMASAIKTVLNKIRIVSFIPDEIRKRFGLMNLFDAYVAIHMPQKIEETEKAKRSIGIEFLNYSLCVYNIIKNNRATVKTRKYDSDLSKVYSAVERLPYRLTEDQNAALIDILNDMKDCVRMNRLLQGDVGSGKTIVALLAMYYAFISGYQSVLMAPTEILAIQHYSTLRSYFPEIGDRCCLLTSGMKIAEKQNVKESIENGKFAFVIGTHAVFGDDVKFSDLALIVTDEQQRFGVNQRSSLENKSANADFLTMSATPIPRTLALTLYGDLKQSLIKSAPKNKADIITKIVFSNREASMWNYFVECSRRDERTYVVCPRIEEDEDEELVSCVKLYKEKKELCEIGLLHGQMSEKEKNNVMLDFASGKIKILITTTVIEVGVDVPQAVNIAIYNPERYGLSQLHQLRGRVGRGTKRGYCFLMGESVSENAMERLQYMTKCSDGFELAEYDFANRGAGDFLGESQHGKGNMPTDVEIIKTSKMISDELLTNEEIKKEIAITINENRYNYYKNITLN